MVNNCTMGFWTLIMLLATYYDLKLRKKYGADPQNLKYFLY
ncbi:hypothetical protein LACWKB10_0478 [Lactobacillus sp. wkB10]|nr:hypothetical protein LACWKB10_0478 [Lactobacillus sp. wkB10]